MSGAGAMRCFIACFLDDDSAGRLVSGMPRLEGIRQVSGENLHVTLQFLGNVAEERCEPIRQAVMALGGQPTTTRVLTVTGYPSPVRARTIVARLKPDPKLLGWHDALSDLLKPTAGARKFDPHVTLGRSRAGIRVPELSEFDGVEIGLRTPALYRSETRPEGARYSILNLSSR